MIPLLDLKAANAPMQAAIDAAVLRVARSGWYVLGPEVEAFEHAWADYCGAGYCVATGNALDAMRIILTAYGIGPGDEVIVPSNTYIATWLAVTHAGATPIPVEPLYDTMNINPARVEAAVTPRTRAVLAVHLYGTPADMAQLRVVCDRNRLLLLDDAAQAHGARTPVRGGGSLWRVGGVGDATAFSFYPTKNLGALGDAGCITTGDSRIAAAARRLRNYGGVGRLDHDRIGINSRMDELQAAVLLAKLPYLDAMNARRWERADTYTNALTEAADDSRNLTLPFHDPGAVWHQYVCRAHNRDLLRMNMEANGVEVHVHYPVPPHLEGAYQKAVYSKQPIAEALGRQVFSLPIGYDVDQNHVIDLLLKSCKNGALR